MAWQQAGRGQCKVVLISGELGIGKTRLWQTWAAIQPPAQVMLETRCLNTTQAVPFDPLRRLLSGTQCRTHFAAIAADLLPVWRTELLRIAPGLQQGLAPSLMQPLGSSAATPAEERGLVAEALTQFLRSFAARPLIFFLDDLHWADEATLNWLLYLTDRMAAEPLLLVGAYRPEDAPPLLTRLVAQWQRDGLLQRMPLPHLTKAEATELLATLGRTMTLADHLHTQSGGNPYYLTQLSDVAVDAIPAPLTDLVQARLRALDEALQPIVQAAAVLEPTINLAILGHMSGRSEEETLDGIDGLLAAAVLVERADLYEFAHPLVAAVVRDGLSNGRRKLLHRRAAEGMVTHYADQLPTVAGQLTHHYGEAGETTEAARFAEMAGEEALRIGAATEAVAFFQQAYSLEPTSARQLGLGRALTFLPGKLTEARAAMEAALTEFEAQRDCQGTIKAGLQLAGSYLSTGEGAQVLHWARRVLPDLETVEEFTFHASAHYLMGTAKFRNGYAMQEAAAHYAEATRLATAHELQSDVALMSWFEWGNLELEAGNYTGAVEKFQQARQVAQAGRSIFFETLSLNNLGYATLLTGALEAAKAFVDTGLALAETYALQPPQQYLYSTQGELALAAGELPMAECAFQQALALAEKYDNPTFAANVRAHLGRVAAAHGALDEAYRLLTAAKAGVTGDTAFYLQTQIDLWLAELHLQRRERTEADASLRLAAERLATGQNRILQEKALQLRRQLHSV
ncbi:MAG: AAA family ATPase [Caldilineaceae bacterium]